MSQAGPITQEQFQLSQILNSKPQSFQGIPLLKCTLEVILELLEMLNCSESEWRERSPKILEKIWEHLEDIMHHHVFVIDVDLIKNTFEAIPQAKNRDINHWLTLMSAKNAFLNLLKEAEKETLTELFIKHLFTEAKKANDAGFYSAFYILGKHFLHSKMIEEGLDAFEKVDERSPYYELVHSIFATFYFTSAQKEPHEDKSQRRHNLAYTLQCALRAEKKVQQDLLPKIASFYLTGDCSKVESQLKEVLSKQTIDKRFRVNQIFDYFDKCAEYLEKNDPIKKAHQQLLAELDAVKKANAQLMEENAWLKANASQSPIEKKKKAEPAKKTVSAKKAKQVHFAASANTFLGFSGESQAVSMPAKKEEKVSEEFLPHEEVETEDWQRYLQL